MLKLDQTSRQVLVVRGGIARQSGRDARVNLDEILRRGVREGIILIVAGKMLARC